MIFDLQTEHICTFTALLDPNFEVIGPTPSGLKMDVFVTGGTVKGKKLNGTFRAGGGDWLTIRPDGVGILDVRITLETDDGALIYFTYKGVADMGDDGYTRFLEGNPVLKMPLRCAPLCLTSHPDYAWMNRKQFILVGEGDLTIPHASYDLYAII